jgi:hypothetical protein
LLNPDKIIEQNGVGNYKKLKIGKFSMVKTYKKQIIEDLVEEVIAEREK